MNIRPRWRRLLLFSTLGLLVVWLGMSGIVAWKLSHRSGGMISEPPPDWPGIAIEAVRLKTTDGEEIGGWFLPSDERACGVLMIHGIGGNRTGMADLIREVRSRGYSVMAISARAHGDSTGTKVDAGYSSRHDAHAAIEFLHQRRPGKPVVVMGQSLGAAAAIFDAADSAGRVDGYFLESPYRDLSTAIWNRLDMRLVPPLSHIAYGGLHLWAPLFISDIDKIRPIDHMADIPAAVPIVIIASEADQHARIDEARDLAARAGSHARLVTVTDSPHTQILMNHAAEYSAALQGLLQAVEKKAMPAKE